MSAIDDIFAPNGPIPDGTSKFFTTVQLEEFRKRMNETGTRIGTRQVGGLADMYAGYRSYHEFLHRPEYQGALRDGIGPAVEYLYSVKQQGK